MKISRKAISVIILSIAVISENPSDAATIYTSTEDSKCTNPSKEVLARYTSGGADVQECKGVNGWRLFVAYTNERSWIDLKYGDEMWTTEEEVVQENDFGYFPNVSGTAEWSTATGGVPSSVIFRVSAQDPGPQGAMRGSIYRYFTIKLKQGEATFCGLAKTKEKARALATSGKCDKPLKKLAQPKKSKNRKQ